MSLSPKAVGVLFPPARARQKPRRLTLRKTGGETFSRRYGSFAADLAGCEEQANSEEGDSVDPYFSAVKGGSLLIAFS